MFVLSTYVQYLHVFIDGFISLFIALCVRVFFLYLLCFIVLFNCLSFLIRDEFVELLACHQYQGKNADYQSSQIMYNYVKLTTTERLRFLLWFFVWSIQAYASLPIAYWYFHILGKHSYWIQQSPMLFLIFLSPITIANVVFVFDIFHIRPCAIYGLQLIFFKLWSPSLSYKPTKCYQSLHHGT